MKNLKILLISLLSSIMFLSCEKHQDQEAPPSINKKKILELAMDYYFFGDYKESSFQSFPGFEEIISQQNPTSGIMSVNSGCPLRTRIEEPGENPKDILEYGTGCSSNGRYYSGNLVYTYFQSPDGNYVYTKYTDFRVQSFIRNGDMTLYYPPHNEGDIERRIYTGIFDCEYIGTGTAKMETRTVFSYPDGQGSGLEILYDVLDKASFTDLEGNNIDWILYTDNVPLIKLYARQYIKSGTLHVKLADDTYIGYISFGEADQENVVKYTVDGETFSKELK